MDRAVTAGHSCPAHAKTMYRHIVVSQDVDVCLEMFNCVPAEQTVAMRKAKFLKRFNNSNNILCQTFAVEAAKELATL